MAPSWGSLPHPRVEEREPTERRGRGAQQTIGEGFIWHLRPGRDPAGRRRGSAAAPRLGFSEWNVVARQFTLSDDVVAHNLGIGQLDVLDVDDAVEPPDFVHELRDLVELARAVSSRIGTFAKKPGPHLLGRRVALQVDAR